VVSSPAFLEHHFERHYPGEYESILIENRLTASFTGGDRPSVPQIAQTPTTGKPLRLGWVGILRCQRSLDLLCETARQLGPDVEIRIHGIIAENEIPNFEAQIAALDNIKFFGRYRAPEDLNEIYANLDLIWSGDFMEAGFNSVWLLPNRIYEGGFFATPSISPAGTQTARWVGDHNCGFSLTEPLEFELPGLIEKLIATPAPIDAYRRQLAELPLDVFVQPAGLMRSTLERVLSTYGNQPGVPQPTAFRAV